jgi:hypothetical protein
MPRDCVDVPTEECVRNPECLCVIKGCDRFTKNEDGCKLCPTFGCPKDEEAAVNEG